MPLGTELGLGRGDTVLDGDPAPHHGAQQPPPTLRPMSIVTKRSPISATAELLLPYLSLRSPRPVAGRHSYGAEAIDGNAEDGVDGTQAGRVVEREPEVTQQLTEQPRLVREHVDTVQRH